MKIFGNNCVRNININLAVWLALVLSAACNKAQPPERQALASAFGETLYRDQIPPSVIQGKSGEDSVLAVKVYVDKWISDKVFEHFARQNVDTAYVNRLAREYARTLLFDLYENKLQAGISDRVQIGEAELKAYYEQEKHNFLAGDTLVRWRYLLVPNDNYRRNAQLKKLFFSSKPEDLEKLETYYKDFIDVKIDSTGWIPYREAMKIMPVLTVRKGHTPGRQIKIRQNILYLADILNVIFPGDELPYDYVKPKIAGFVKHRKLNREVRKLKQEMLNDAIQKKQVKYYFP